ncbi:MAG: sialate O-acetylesterase [Blastopirellula sp.]|nr:MAG: sialate O-acetylesterase [Blastopirellula sp.]
MLVQRYVSTINVLVIASLLITLPSTSVAQENKSLKVFFLVGQSNMEGKGNPIHLDTYKDTPEIEPHYKMLKDGSGWSVRNDVYITYPSKNGGAKHGPLTVGYGTKGEDSIGPEFGFGHAIGETLSEPVLLIKIAWGGKSLHRDFRPPSAAPSDDYLQLLLDNIKTKNETAKKKKPVPTIEELKKSYGFYYREMIRHAKEELAAIDSKFPELKGLQPEISGFVWHQGFNDKINAEYKETKYADYTKWLGMFIQDVRKDLNAPNMPFVIGELSTGGIPSRGDFQVAQANTVKIKELKDAVAFVPTAEYYDTAAHELYKKNFWKGTDEQKAQWRAVGNDRPYHYLGSGKTYFLKGVAFAEAMNELLHK